MLAEEHQARLNAESEAAHSSRRLAVAQEQVAEYAAQRQAEAGRLLEQVEAALGKLTANEDDSVGSLLQVRCSQHLCLPRLANQFKQWLTGCLRSYKPPESARVLRSSTHILLDSESPRDIYRSKDSTRHFKVFQP